MVSVLENGYKRRIVFWRELILFFLLAIALINYSKGFVNQIQQTYVQGYWVLNYHNGLIRRGLLGELLSFLYDQNNLDRVLSAAFCLHLITCMLLLIGLWAWLQRLLDRQWEPLLLAIFAVFATSQFLPTQAYDAGFLDVYDYVLVLIAAFAMLGNAYLVAAAAGFVGPFIHEAFIFVWLTISILAFWNSWSRKTIAVLLCPVIATAIVYVFSSETAGVSQIVASPLAATAKGVMTEFVFSQTITSSLKMMAWKYQHNANSFAWAAIFFTFPALVITAVYASTRGSARDVAYLTGAALAPAAILIFALDLSRFLVGTAFSALLSVFYMHTVKPTAISRPFTIGVASTVAALGLALPLVQALFDNAVIIDRGLVPFVNNPAASAVNWIFSSVETFPPLPADAKFTDPPGNVWDEQEDAWDGVWTRRPGTNVFDAVWTRGKQKITGVLLIKRYGERIVVERTSSDGNNVTYNGRLEGSRVTGRYAGGPWLAVIRQ